VFLQKNRFRGPAINLTLLGHVTEIIELGVKKSPVDAPSMTSRDPQIQLWWSRASKFPKHSTYGGGWRCVSVLHDSTISTLGTQRHPPPSVFYVFAHPKLPVRVHDPADMTLEPNRIRIEICNDFQSTRNRFRYNQHHFNSDRLLVDWKNALVSEVRIRSETPVSCFGNFCQGVFSLFLTSSLTLTRPAV